MTLLSEDDRQKVRTHFAGLTHAVTLLFFTQAIGAPETVFVTRRILDEVVALSNRLTLEEVNLVLDREKAEQYGIAAVPAIVLLRDGQDTRMRFLGAPAGYEFMSLVEAVLLAGGDEPTLLENSRTLIARHVTGPVDIKVFVTPTCPHCPKSVALAHRVALESPYVQATCIEATEFLELSRQYRVTGVPKTIVSGAARVLEILGAVPEDELVRALIQAASTSDAAVPEETRDPERPENG